MCDPGENANTDVVKGAAELLLRDMKRKHWLDPQSRFVVITVQLAVPNAGLAARLCLMFELPAAGGVLPAFQVRPQL